MDGNAYVPNHWRLPEDLIFNNQGIAFVGFRRVRIDIVLTPSELGLDTSRPESP